MIKLTHEQARAYGIAVPPPPSPRRRPVDGLNKLERDFRDRVLVPAQERGRVGRWWWEPAKLRLAGRTWYAPDFLVATWDHDPVLPPAFTFVELKGFLRDDASVKVKVAAREYPSFRFLLVYRRRGIWLTHLVTPTGGITHGNVLVPWIHG